MVLLKTVLDRRTNGSCVIDAGDFQTVATQVRELTRLQNDMNKDFAQHRLDEAREHNAIQLAITEGKP